MLVVKPNPRRMQQFRNSPAENALAGSRGRRFLNRPQWGRAFLSIGIAVVIVAGLFALAGHLRF